MRRKITIIVLCICAILITYHYELLYVNALSDNNAIDAGNYSKQDVSFEIDKNSYQDKEDNYSHISLSEYDLIISIRSMSKEEAIEKGISEEEYDYINSSKIEENLLTLKKLSREELTKYGFQDFQIDILKNYNGGRIEYDESIKAASATCTAYFTRLSASTSSYKLKASWSWNVRPLSFGLTESGEAVMTWSASDTSGYPINASFSSSGSSCTVNFYTGPGVYTGSLYPSIHVSNPYGGVSCTHQSMNGTDGVNLGFAKSGSLTVKVDHIGSGVIEEVAFVFAYFHDVNPGSISFTFGWPSISFTPGHLKDEEIACRLKSDGTLINY